MYHEVLYITHKQSYQVHGMLHIMCMHAILNKCYSTIYICCEMYTMVEVLSILQTVPMYKWYLVDCIVGVNAMHTANGCAHSDYQFWCDHH